MSSSYLKEFAMLKTCVLKSKIHRVKITHTDICSDGGVVVDESFMKAAAMVENEKIHVVNIDNGERFVSYIKKGPPGSGICSLHGADSRRGAIGDIIIIISYARMELSIAKNYRPHIIFPAH
jgi:aspartate 1-decarboxylase